MVRLEQPLLYCSTCPGERFSPPSIHFDPTSIKQHHAGDQHEWPCRGVSSFCSRSCISVNTVQFHVEASNITNCVLISKSTITGTVQPSGDTATTLFRIANLTSQDILNVPGFSLSLHFDPIPLVMRENGNAHGPNEMGGFNGPDSLIIWYTEYSWSNEEDDGKIAIAASDMLQQAEIDAAIINRANPFICLNVAGSGQSPFQSYGADYQTWLEGAAKLYDPSGVFQKVMPGGFKVFDDTPVFNPAPVFGGT